MADLTKEQCRELEHRVVEKMQDMFGGDNSGLRLSLCKLLVPTVICTLQEYERMKAQQ